jgi:rhamnosyltransferase
MDHNKSVCVLLSSYNGAKFITTQLDSLLAQRDVNLKILVRDDGSRDDTCSILEQYQRANKLSLIRGENIGYVKSFYTLVRNAPASDYYAYCDQDDFWEEDKLIAAISKLENHDKEKPALYFSALKIVDDNLKFKCNSHQNFKTGKYPFQQSFMRVAAYGCTLVFNNAARDNLLKYDYDTFYAHDTSLYMTVAALGNLVFDSIPHIQYRQHGGNAFGYSKSSLKKIKSKLSYFFNVECKNMRLKEMRKIKEHFYGDLSPENKNFCDLVCNYKNSRHDKNNLLNYQPFRSGNLMTDLTMRYLIKMGMF